MKDQELIIIQILWMIAEKKVGFQIADRRMLC